jgi:hypothetical protein
MTFCRRAFPGLLAMGALVAMLVSLAACDRLHRRAEAPAPPTVAAPARAPVPTALPRGRGLASIAAFARVTDPLAVLLTQPTDGARDTAVDTATARIVVQFNHPVVPLVSAAAQAALTSPLSIDPPITGSGRWLNTATYEFHPAATLAGSTRYEVRVPAGTRDAVGQSLAADHAVAFTTELET